MARQRGILLFAYALMAPALIYLFVIIIYPLFDTIRLSFTDTSLRPVSHWVGLANFRALWNPEFGDVVLRTIVWTVASVALKLAVGLYGALLLNTRVPGRSLFRVLIMPPWIVPVAVGAFAWGWMYNGQFGMISGLLQRLGLSDGPIPFLGYPKLAFWSTIVTDVWVGTPLVILYLLAALQAIPDELHEAAWVDGAGRLQRLRHVTLPLMLPAIAGMGLLSGIFTLRSFDPIWILTSGGPNDATNTMIIDTYRIAFGRFHYGEGAARTVAICLMLGVLAAFYLRLVARAERRARTA
jgi:multiple sugar transport system permease protein